MEEAMASPCYSDMCGIVQGVDQGFFNRWDLQQLEVALGQGSEQSPSSESHCERPKKQLRTRSWSSCTTAADQSSASAPRILSFGKPDSPICHSGFYGGVVKKKVEEAAEGSVSNGSRRSTPAKRTSAHNHEHIMAERKRREKLSQRFIELSAIVPGLKKMDKASVLSDAIKYLKQLQDKVMNLEDQITKRSIESAVLVRKTQLCVEDDADDDGHFNDDRRRRSCFLPPKIEARVCDKSILIKIHCENRKGVLVQALSEIEKLHLSVVNTSVIPFPGNSLDITVASQIEEAFSMSARDVVKRLNSAFRQFK
ncbi:transcription factor bHLH18-like isoform X1 [Zingiber officinale]|uniref:transcription factor bHLH18-like isoform X1 n=1 Tax=Zingiber officinale TaxID=94328 RepID=UPI001C4CAA94|nr:transcription factor bHLH18-like isoform X1 [Zingiber officinale]